LLNSAQAETKSLVTDEQLIRETIAAEPDIVSIDSPLSVPDGWNRLQEQLVDGSPIYRKCELALSEWASPSLVPPADHEGTDHARHAPRR